MGCEMAEEPQVCSHSNHSDKSTLSRLTSNGKQTKSVSTNEISNLHYDIGGILHLELDFP